MNTNTKTETKNPLSAQETELAEMRAALDAREKALQDAKTAAANERNAKLFALPTAFGLANIDELIAELRKANKAAHKTATNTGPHTRAKITDEVKAKAIVALTGGKTAKEVAKELGISEPSVNLIKKSAGLVKARANVETIAQPAPATETAAAA